MRYKPVYIATLRDEKVNAETRRHIRFTPVYYSVLSRKFGECGHRHKTEKAAEPCLRKMRTKWAQFRSEISRLAHYNKILANGGNLD